jgi:uncharacterized damage-inducible protein DinB
MREWAKDYYLELPSYLGALDDAHADEEVRFPWAEQLVQRFGQARTALWAESVQQVALHSSYHRGQVARRLREIGAESPLTDFVAWVWMGKPVADWGTDDAA